jgi:tetratricopeptide (TPR) repeat protein
MGQRQIGTFLDARHHLQSLEVPIPPDLERRVCTLLRREALDGFSAATGRELAQMWLTLLNARGDDVLAWIVALLLFESCFDPQDPRWWEIDAALQEQTTLGGRSMRAIGTHFEIKRRLAGRLYDFGRRGKVSAANRGFLQAAIDLFDELVARDHNASRPNVRLKYVGMRGVAHLLLARGDEDPALRYSRYTLASVDLEESGRLGDTSAEHDQYLLEAYFKRLDATGDATILDRAGEIVRDARARHTTARGLLTQEGELLLRRALLLPKTPETTEEQLRLLETALHSFEAALVAPPHHAFADDYIRMKCGMSRFRIYVARSKSGDNDLALLDAAITDLDRFSEDGSGDVGLSLPWALTLRAQSHAVESQFDAALVDLERAAVMANALPESPVAAELRKVVRTRIAVSRLSRAVTAGGVDVIDAATNEVLDSFAPDPKIVSSMAHAGRALLKLGSNDTGLILRIVQFADAARQDASADATAVAYACANAAGLLSVIAKGRGSDEHLVRAHALFSEALTIADQAPTEWWGFAGDVALKLAKKSLVAGDDGEATQYLEDAVSWFSAGIGSAAQQEDKDSLFSNRDAYSKLGEAYVRLHAITPLDEYAASAISAMAESIGLGNNTPQIYGLLADVHYRRGRSQGSVNDLREALRLKALAREVSAGAPVAVANWRENLSLSAGIAFRIFRVTYVVEDLAAAVVLASNAAREDPAWPWPIFQLAAMAAAARGTALRHVLKEGTDNELTRLVLEGAADELNRRACHLAILNPSNLELKILGGRQKVYVLRDSHRLLSESFVFKPTSEESAKRELASVAEFREFLAEQDAPRAFRLPTPLTTIAGDRTGAVTYVMRRSEGVQLGTYVLRSMRLTDVAPADVIDGAIAFLAHYHGWKLLRPGRRVGHGVDRVLTNIGHLWRSTFDPDAARTIVSQLRGLLPSGLPLLAKKDAHPENWLVTSRRDIVMLDLEATTQLPLLFEVAQFLEDYPFFDCSTAGWAARLRVVDHYLGTVSRLAPEFSIPALAVCRDAYEKYALVRAAIGIGETRTSAPQASSVSSVLRAVTARREHYLALSQYLAMHGTDASTRAVATSLVEAATKRTHNTAPAEHAAEPPSPSDHWVW